MKKIFAFVIVSLISSNIFAEQNISNDTQFAKYLEEYGKASAPYQLCGEYDMADIANIGIYLDEIVTPSYLKVLINRYGSLEKAGSASIDKAQAIANKEKHKLVDEDFDMNACEALFKNY